MFSAFVRNDSAAIAVHIQQLTDRLVAVERELRSAVYRIEQLETMGEQVV